MGKPLGDDLRRKLLYAYDQGEGTLEELAGRFLVSVGWAKKISAQRKPHRSRGAGSGSCLDRNAARSDAGIV